jgi:3-carboxy-cis,cis-muconate cycloisomerase
MAGRTLGQHALPTTFGLTCAGWLVAVDEVSDQLATAISRLAVQFGGAAGTLAALGDDGVRVVRLLADELALAEPVLPWHTDRTRVAQLAGALGSVAGILGKIALDVQLLAQTEVGELAEGSGGTSSAMPHKHNPVHAVLISASARRAPGLVSTLLSAMAHEHQRAAGAWHAEWLPLRDLLGTVGGASAHARDLFAGLRVDTQRMRDNLASTHGLLMSESVAGKLAPGLGRSAAQDLVARLCRNAVRQGRSLRDELMDDAEIRAYLDTDEIDEALDPLGYLGSATAFIARALDNHHAREGIGR